MVATGARRASREREGSNFIPAVGNFSVQYNFTSASAAASFLNDPGATIVKLIRQNLLNVMMLIHVCWLAG